MGTGGTEHWGACRRPEDGGSPGRRPEMRLRPPGLPRAPFLTKKLPKVATEMALNVLAHNMKRVMAIAGVDGLLEAMRA